MDYLHYRFKKWEPFQFLSLSEGKKRVARAYMQQEMEDREKTNEEIQKSLGG